MRSVFLRNDIGIPSELSSAKMERFYQACEYKVTTRKNGFQIFRKFVAFRNVKIGSLPQCLLGKNNFFCVAKVYRFQSVTLGKSDTHRKFND